MGWEAVGLDERPLVGLPCVPGLDMDWPAVDLGWDGVGLAGRILDAWRLTGDVEATIQDDPGASPLRF